MSEYCTITEAAAALRAGEVSSVDLVRRAAAVADAHDAELGTYLARYDESALAAAAAADEALATGAPTSPLHGIPLGIKDILTTSEGPTTGQSLVHDPEWNGRQDAPVVARLRSAGGIVMGKTSTMEFACGLPDASKPFPVPRNPWDTSRYPGGSSSGTGNGVAAGMFFGGLGTDTGGSIRIPAALCGITGLMPTFGRVPKSGCIPLGYSLDHIGPMARSAADCALMLQVLAGHDPSDAGSIDEPVPDYSAALSGDLAGLRIGVDSLAAMTSQDPVVPGLLAAAVAELAAAGADVVDVSLPLFPEVTAALMVTCGGEVLAYHAPDAERVWGEYFAATRDMIARGVFYSAADFVQAQRVRRTAQKAVARMFTDVDLVLTPTNNVGAPALEGITTEIFLTAVNTPYWDAVGNPVLSVPMGFTADGLPIGLQIAGRPFEEALVLQAGDAFQRRTDWHRRVPPLVSALAAV